LNRPADRNRPSDDRDLAEVAMDIQRHCSHPFLLRVIDDTGEPVGKRHRRIRARSATGQVAGAATESPGSEPIVQNGLPNLRSPERPDPSRPNLSPTPDISKTLEQQFHAPGSSSPS
jgi:hypothetical protein